MKFIAILKAVSKHPWYPLASASCHEVHGTTSAGQVDEERSSFESQICVILYSTWQCVFYAGDLFWNKKFFAKESFKKFLSKSSKCHCKLYSVKLLSKFWTSKRFHCKSFTVIGNRSHLDVLTWDSQVFPRPLEAPFLSIFWSSCVHQTVLVFKVFEFSSSKLLQTC